ncbi:MAG TPA: ankyrin repeat domain-containing protein [Desulfomonilaceae bacterium]|nr:ankyrin repeat domain-containing protein [Desulfomonilaceae bacterium]
MAVLNSDLNEVRRLVASRADINENTDLEHPVLVGAAASGDLEIVRFLVRSSAGVKCHCNETALRAAKSNHHHEVVKLLKAYGARD